MEKEFICPVEAWKKLKAAKYANRTVYIFGATGFGKTELIRRFLGGKKHIYLTCREKEPDLETIPREGERKEKIPLPVVVDDLQFLRSEETRAKIAALTEREDLWLILAGRNPIPGWLLAAHLQEGFLVIGEKDLWLKEDAVKEYLARKGLSVREEDVREMCTVGSGNAYVIQYLTRRLLEGQKYDQSLADEMEQVFEGYLETAVIVQWDSRLLEFLMQVSVVDEFGTELAEMITGNHCVAALIRQAEEMGNFLFEQNGVYKMRPVLLKALRNRADRVYGSGRIREYMYNAGLYYEIHDEIVPALCMYEKCGNQNRIRELLINNARRNPGNGHYYELRRFYLGLSEEEIGSSVILMAGMSMLYSLLFQVEKSEYWYEKLKCYAQSAEGACKREAQSRFAYLEIALPHRGIKNMIGAAKSAFTLLTDKGIVLPEFSVTSNLPSTMNGGKDFCEWSRHDRELAASIGRIMERVLGRYGKGLVKAAVAESQYEKGGDVGEILSLLGRSQMEADAGGTAEIAFASVGIQIRLNLSLGYENAAAQLYDSFEKKVQEQKVSQLMPNMRALQCRLALYEGNAERVQSWMEEAPDEGREFYILERYRYLTKVRCYIFLGEYMKACLLLEKLRYYAEQYERCYIRMEAGMLLAVARYRMGDETWKEIFREVLRSASDYGFIRLISEEGGAVLPLLEQEKKEWQSCAGVDRRWFLTVLEETSRMAVRYPVYLKGQMAERPHFSENALTILRLQADGCSTAEIAGRLDMKTETVRYHIKQNYKKLGVSSRADALLAARNLKIL